MPSTFRSPATPYKFEEAITDTTFFVSAGHYYFVIIFYVAWAGVVLLLKTKKINSRFRKVRKLCQSAWVNRIKYGAINECIWLCFMTFTLFSLWQFYDLEMHYRWSSANLAFALLSLGACVATAGWVLHLALKSRKEFENVPKKFAFILGDESHLPYQMPLRYIRKLLLCFFLFTAMIELQLVGMISANFLILSFYCIYRPSKSAFTNYANIIIESCYIIIEMLVLCYINDFNLTTSKKIVYGKAMIAFSAIAILMVSLWMVWQFITFLYDFKCIRDLVEQSKVTSKVHPDEDNLRVDMERDYGKD